MACLGGRGGPLCHVQEGEADESAQRRRILELEASTIAQSSKVSEAEAFQRRVGAHEKELERHNAELANKNFALAKKNAELEEALNDKLTPPRGDGRHAVILSQYWDPYNKYTVGSPAIYYKVIFKIRVTNAVVVNRIFPNILSEYSEYTLQEEFPADICPGQTPLGPLNTLIINPPV